MRRFFRRTRTAVRSLRRQSASRTIIIRRRSSLGSTYRTNGISRPNSHYGVRWDMMDALVGQWQFSPRVGAVYQVAPDTALHAGYARYFQVPPFESVLLGTVGKFAGTTGEPSVTAGNQT